MSKTAKPRMQEIKYDNAGEPFVTHYGVRYYLNEFMKCDYLHNGTQIHGMFTKSAFSALGIHLDDSGDAATVIYIY